MRLLFLFVSLLLLSGCSSRGKGAYQRPHKVTLHPYAKPPKEETPSYHLQNKNSITLALYDEYKKWKGTPYLYGGNSLSGVDCSALVQSVYVDAFGVRVPRTVKEQAKRGYYVAKNEIREGDLVCFKTGWSTLHSGIYLEKGNFMHASSKHGVTISNLNNPYWREKYWQTRRILPIK